MSEAQIEHAEASSARLADGAAAMTAYAHLQFTDMPDGARRALQAALLRYCELDTFAMALIWEHWRNLSV